MKANEIILDMMEKTHASYAGLGYAIGIGGRTQGQVVRNYLHSPRYSLKIKTFLKMLDSMGYMLVCIPKGTTLRDYWYGVTDEEESE